MSFELLLLVCGGIATIAAAVEIIRRYLRKPVHRIKNWLDEQSRAAKTLNGYGPIKDPTTGEILQDEVPGIAKRVTTLENLATQLAESHITLVRMQDRILSLEEWRAEHEEWSERVTAAHADALRRLEEAS